MVLFKFPVIKGEYVTMMDLVVTEELYIGSWMLVCSIEFPSGFVSSGQQTSYPSLSSGVLILNLALIKLLVHASQLFAEQK